MRVLAVALCAVTFLSCGGSDEPDTVALPGRIRGAMTAVDGLLGGPQQYSEVNATESEANVFVVRDGSEGAYVVRPPEIEPPGPMSPYGGPTFAATDVAFGDGLLTTLAEELPDAEVVALSVTPGSGGRKVDYIATVRGTGGEVRVLLGPNGEILDLDVG